MEEIVGRTHSSRYVSSELHTIFLASLGSRQWSAMGVTSIITDDKAGNIGSGVSE